MKIIIFGIGLIGGSIAKALRFSEGGYELYGIDTQEDVILDACSAEILHGKASFEDIATAQVVYLCTGEDAAIDFVKSNAGRFNRSCIITDVCGIKRKICAEIEEISKKHGFTFVGGHPMAGRELSGFAYSDPSIFSGASYILMDDDRKRKEINLLSKLAYSMGFGRIMLTNPEKHDQMIAFTSQLPHIIACAYVKSPRCAEHEGFSAGSYRDVSRVANINSELWCNLFLLNKDYLSYEIDILISNLERYKNLISDSDEKNLTELLDEAAKIKQKD